MPINQPSNQIKLTNVSIVRLKKGGKRFEIACYKNKVQEWRTGVEANLDDVLQISNVFINVSKGQVAPTEDLRKAFGTTDVNEIVQEILKKGELQVGEKEREHALSNMWKDIATQVAEKCVDPTTERPYPVGIIEKAMTEAGFSVKPGKTSKSQVRREPFVPPNCPRKPLASGVVLSESVVKVLECIKFLQSNSNLPIQRARMKVRVTMPLKDGKRLKEQILETAEKVEEDDFAGDEWETILIIDPGQFRVLNELLQKDTALKGKGRVETLSMGTGPGGDL
ncbi:hypothetical protein FRB99_000515 [Tulasnella sp. 403]|nr:hypothetical protein FRB99_000515 [Tulasnella sp. 403]